MADVPMNGILTSGFGILASLLAKGRKSTIGRARVGTAINFAFDENNTTAPSPTTIFTVDSSNIAVDLINNNQEVRFAITFTEQMGNFNVGNMVLDLNVDGVMVPFAWWISDVIIPKIKPSDNDVGNRFIISFIEKFQNVFDAIEITVTSPFYSSLPTYSTELTVPLPQQALYQQFAMQQFSTLRTPALGMRRSGDNRYFGIPFMQRLDDPFFGVLGGGYVKDNYYPYSGDIYWGGYFITPLTDYIATISGGSLADTFITATYQCDPLTYIET